MKRILISMLIVGASSAAFAKGVNVTGPISENTNNVVCNGDATGGKASVNGGPGAVPATTVFTRSGFDMQCSANVFMIFNEVNTTTAVIGSSSAKGNQFFGGHSNGGAIGALGKCAAAACVQGDAESAITKAKEAASSATGTGG